MNAPRLEKLYGNYRRVSASESGGAKAPEGGAFDEGRYPTEGMPQAANGAAVERCAGHAGCSRAKAGESFQTASEAIGEAVAQLQEAAAARKCWRCGCLHHSLKAIGQAFPAENRPIVLSEVIEVARQRLVGLAYDCLGCAVCYPAIALNALDIGVDTCPTGEVAERAGWPPLPGSYAVLRYQAPVAVCTLTDERLARQIAAAGCAEVAIAGMLQTENLGIERLILNVLANPNIRFLVVCGPDSRQAIGHLPGQSLVALARSGLDERGRIIGAGGKRPVLRNLPVGAVEYFRRTVEVVDRVGNTQLSAILEAVQDCAGRNPGPAAPFAPERVVEPIAGYLPARMVTDPAGYFVVYVDRQRQLLSLEHYQNNGVLDAVIEGRSAAELYTPAIEQGLLSRLDHAAYLGQELARSEQALLAGGLYVQDGAPERRAVPATDSGCGCGAQCGEEER
jgi:tetrahydromethanopterin S-methyltransferase subunit A